MKAISITVHFIFFFLATACAQEIRFRKITSGQGLSHNTVYAVTQDEKGFIWFGTREGLNRYDSYEVRTYYIDSDRGGRSANTVSALLCVGTAIYAGTESGLYKYDPKADKIEDNPINIPPVAVLSLLADHHDIYVGTAAGLYRLHGNRAALIIPGNKPVKALGLIGSGRLMTAIGNSLQIVDGNGRILRKFTDAALPPLSRSDFSVFNIYRDQHKLLWLSTNYGLFQYNDESQRFTRMKFAKTETEETNTVRAVTRKQNLLYIGTEDGLYAYDLRTGHCEHYGQSFNNDPKKLNDKAIYSTFLAGDGSVWIGTYFGGVNYIPASTAGFRTLMPSDTGNGIRGKAISEMMEDSNRRIWIGTEDGGISVYDPASQTFSYINKDTAPFYLPMNNVHAIHDDGYGNIWVGTFLGGLVRLDTRKNKTTVYTNDPENRYSLSNDLVYAIHRDSRGNLWIGTQSGLNRYNYQDGHFSLFKPETLGNRFIYDLTEDKNGDIWICTRQNGIFRYVPAADSLVHYTASRNPNALKSDQVISVYQDSRQQLWFGTLDGGVTRYNPQKNAFQTFSSGDGLPNNNVYGILEDPSGIMWFTTNRGISAFNPQTGHFANFDAKYGLPSNQFNFKSYLKSSDGTLYFGSINGLCFFDATKIGTGQPRLPLRFTGFEMFNKPVVPGKSPVLSNQIDYTDELTLSYRDNVFTLSFAAINYANPGSTNYTYYLEGFQDKWTPAGDKRSVTYTNLSPGHYTFHVKATDASGRPLSAERTLHIQVTPPFYLSRSAFFIYLLLFGAAIWFYYLFVRFLHKKKLEIQLERIEKEKTKELTQHRLNFFTFISHEFKTPLTLILASIEKFTQEQATFKKSPELRNIKSNASILFRLIQQLMEFRKIETDYADVTLSHADIIGFIKQAALSFKTICGQKGTGLTLTAMPAALECYFDKDKIEKIIFNILSNAVKNTSGGNIHLHIECKEQHPQSAPLTITVTDTGKGMTPKELKNIFNPFYKSTPDNNGSGIGLALVQSLVNYLNGKITVESTPGAGTTLNVELPLIFEPRERERQQPVPEEEEPDETAGKSLPAANDISEAKTNYTVLIAEDNKELLSFLAGHFSKTYTVITANNGLSALKKISKTPPDIIVSDVKMPKMSGLELCNKVKTDSRFGYIPFILLSDNNTDQVKLNGLDVGADAYLGKPFNLKEFELLIANMIKSRVKLRERVISISEFSADYLPDNNKDQEFLKKLSEVLEKEFSNPAISIEDIAAKLHMSRTSLHLHLKRILNKSATDLLNEYRLKRAAIMLENDMPISETAYACGYSDPNYFSRIFKKYYQQTPVRYKEKKGQQLAEKIE